MFALGGKKQQKKQFHRILLFSIDHDLVLGQLDDDDINGNHHPADLWDIVESCSLHINWELVPEALAVKHKVILARAWELINVPIKRLEVEVSPHAADVVDMVTWRDCKKKKEKKKICNSKKCEFLVLR